MSMKSAALLMVTAAMGLAACTGHQTPARAWVVRTYPGDGMVATLTQPPDWTVQLPPANAHYAAVFAYLGSFPLRPFCHKTANRVFCSPGEAGAFPPAALWSSWELAATGPGHSRESACSRTDDPPSSVDGARRYNSSTADPAWAAAPTTSCCTAWMTVALKGSSRSASAGAATTPPSDATSGESHQASV